MKRIGLIGGISWVSTVDYYHYINEGINAALGRSNYATCMIWSLNYEEIKKNNAADDWDANFRLMAEGARHLKNGGAEALVLCANTAHLLADRIAAETGLPVIHTAEETAEAITQQGLRKVALLGTKFTMERDFFKDKLKARGIEALIPEADDREFIHYTIGEELDKGLLKPESKARYQRIIAGLAEAGAEGVILGCTEIPLLVKPADVSIPTFDTTAIHAAAAVRFMLS